MVHPEISYFEYPVSTTNQQIEDLPDEFGLLLPVLDNVTGFIIDDNNPNHSNTLTCTDQYTKSNSTIRDFRFEQEEKVSEEDIQYYGSQQENSVKDSELNDTLVLYNHGPLYEDDSTTFKMHYVGVKRKAVRDYAVGYCLDKENLIEVNNQINVNNVNTMESILDLRTLRRDTKKLRYSSKRMITSAQSNVMNDTLHDESMHMENAASYYARLANVQYVQASVLLEEGLVTSTIVDIPNKNVVYRHRHGTWKLVYRRYKSRIVILILIAGVVCLGLGISGQITRPRLESNYNNGNDEISIMPTNQPTFQPSHETLRLLSAIYVKQDMRRTSTSGLLSDEVINNFEQALLNNMTGGNDIGVVFNISASETIASRIVVDCRVIYQEVNLLANNDRSLRNIETNGVFFEPNESIISSTMNDNDRQLQNESNILGLTYNISWHSMYSYWQETSNMVEDVENYLSDLINRGGMDEILTFAGVEVDNNGTKISDIKAIILPSAQPSVEPTLEISDEPSYVNSEEPSSENLFEYSGYPSLSPSEKPSKVNSLNPTTKPSIMSSNLPSIQVTTKPSNIDSGSPSSIPSSIPSQSPSYLPSVLSSNNPSVSTKPTVPNASPLPSNAPSEDPSSAPSYMPSHTPSSDPSVIPSILPSLSFKPTPIDATTSPTSISSDVPSSQPSSQPSHAPSIMSSHFPSALPSESLNPSRSPTKIESGSPSSIPSSVPSQSPSYLPSVLSSNNPSVSGFPSSVPSLLSSSVPTIMQSSLPSSDPSSLPSSIPSKLPSGQPSRSPSSIPSSIPSSYPSVYPSFMTSSHPTTLPSFIPSIISSFSPSTIPSSYPSSIPSSIPSHDPSIMPSKMPSSKPSVKASVEPSSIPSTTPSTFPSFEPSSIPTVIISRAPSGFPSSVPSLLSSSVPTIMPSSLPSSDPSSLPSSMPSMNPTSSPSLSTTVRPTVSSLDDFDPFTNELSTSFISNAFQDGNQFDVYAKTDLTITEIDVNLRAYSSDANSSLAVEIYTKDDSFRNHETDSSAWDQVGVCNVFPNAVDEPTTLPYGCFVPINILAGETKGFYITVNSQLSDGSMNYAVGNQIGSTIVEDNHLKIKEGSGIDYPFNSIHKRRRWSGTMRYYVNKKLTTEFSGDYISDGIVFEVYSRSADIAVHEMEIHTIGEGETYECKVWTKDGTISSSQNDWAMIVDQDVVSNGQFTATNLPNDAFNQVVIVKGERMAFYIDLTCPQANCLVSTYTADQSSIFFTNDSFLSIYTGFSASNFVVDSDAGVIWNGSFIYTLASWNFPSIPPGSNPTPSPTQSPSYEGIFELSSGFDGQNLNHGCMFDIIVSKTIAIEAMAIHIIGSSLTTENDIAVEIYFKSDTYENSEYNASAWNQIGDAYMIPPQAEGEETLIDGENFIRTLLDEGRYGIYITVNPTLSEGYSRMVYSDNSNFDHNNQKELGDVLVANNDLAILVGAGVRYTGFEYEQNSLTGPRMFNGAFYYAHIVEPSYEPTSLPSQVESNYPSIKPSEQISVTPSNSPSLKVSNIPSTYPSQTSSISPSNVPTIKATFLPSHQPSDAIDSSVACCSDNYKDCKDSVWCNDNETNCVSGCQGTWLPTGAQTQCLARWENCLSSSLPCCGPAVCVGDNFYKQCK